MTDLELKNVIGGEMTGTFLNSIARIFTVIIDIGRSFGSALNYWKNKRSC